MARSTPKTYGLSQLGLLGGLAGTVNSRESGGCLFAMRPCENCIMPPFKCAQPTTHPSCCVCVWCSSRQIIAPLLIVPGMFGEQTAEVCAATRAASPTLRRSYTACSPRSHAGAHVPHIPLSHAHGHARMLASQPRLRATNRQLAVQAVPRRRLS